MGQILNSAEDAFELEPLGTVGNVVAHGGTLAYHRLRTHIQMGHPTVMLCAPPTPLATSRPPPRAAYSC